MIEVRRIASASAPDRLVAEVRALLGSAFAGDFTEADWQHTVGGWHVLAEEDGRIVAHAAVVGRLLHVGDRAVPCGYVEGVATAPDRQRQGLGSRVMSEVAGIIGDGYELGALSTGSTGFYGRLGWELWRGPTFVRHGTGLVRTEDEDGGVMVLRSARTADLDLGAPIACERRPGDDW